jgi:hypothetical protein
MPENKQLEKLHKVIEILDTDRASTEEVAEALLEYLFPEGGYDDRWMEYAYAAAEKMIDSEEIPVVLKCQK